MLDPKEKKKEQQKKNKRNQEIFNLLRLRRQEAERVENEANSRKPSRDSSADDDDPLWSEKVSTIRNKLTGKKRTSKDRWNRFAGTDGGGGMGL